jgi:hypothetical protein
VSRDLGPLNSFNRGIISPLALGRIDVERVRLSASEQTNFVPRVLGSMMLRPGTAYVGDLGESSWLLPFVFSKADTAIIKFVDGAMKLWVNEALLSRPTVATTITNGTFTGNITGWTDADESGAASTYSATASDGTSGGYLKLVGTGFASAIVRQTLTVAGGDQNVQHALRIKVEYGPLRVRIGSTSGGEELLTETSLWDGEHSIAFVPTGANVYVQLSNVRKHPVYVDSVAIESGAVSITSPYAIGDMPKLRHSQSADVVFLWCDGYEEYRIERRTNNSWSLVKNRPEDGPFRSMNFGPINLTASATSGAITLTASKKLFKAGHKGALFRIDSTGQLVTQAVSGENQWSGDIRVSGAGTEQRRFTITRSGTWSGTVTLQRSVAEPGAWVPVATYTTNATINFDDGLDDQIIYYRIGIDAGDYTSGTVNLTMNYPNGSIRGVVRLVGITSETVATAHVIQDLGNTAASDQWSEGAWSDYRGHPTSGSLFEGRLWHAGRNWVWSSVVDSYLGYDDDVEGDAGPISRTIGEGPIDGINWIMPMQRLVLSTDVAERSAKASSLDDPLTPSSFTLKQISSQGSARIAPVVMDDMGVFLQAGGLRLYALRYNTDASVTSDYAPEDLTALAPRIGEPGIVNLAYQRQPDTRIHAVRSDGTVAMLVFDRLEDVKCWVEIVTDGNVKQVIVLPGDEEDRVYYVVERTGGTYLERWAMEPQADGGTDNRCLDSHVVYSGASTTSITGLGHLEGEEVYAWSNGDVSGPYTVSGGAITLGSAATYAVVGLSYRGRYRSAKLVYGSPQPLAQKKRVAQIGLILGPTHREAIEIGTDWDHLDPLPIIESGAPVTTDWDEYDEVGVPVNGTFDTDSRLHIQVDAPRHATLLAAVVNVEVNEKTFR